jgi:hypothetical protein
MVQRQTQRQQSPRTRPTRPRRGMIKMLNERGCHLALSLSLPSTYDATESHKRRPFSTSLSPVEASVVERELPNFRDTASPATAAPFFTSYLPVAVTVPDTPLSTRLSLNRSNTRSTGMRLTDFPPRGGFVSSSAVAIASCGVGGRTVDFPEEEDEDVLFRGAGTLNATLACVLPAESALHLNVSPVVSRHAKPTSNSGHSSADAALFDRLLCRRCDFVVVSLSSNTSPRVGRRTRR